jgi:hypothetical protein
MAEIENPQIKQFYQDALTFIQATKKGPNPADPCFVIRPGMDEWIAWAAYLQDRCGLLPAVMKAVEKRRLDSYTVPAQWPQWFDAFYRAPEKPFYRSEVRPEITTEERAKTIAAMEAYKRNPPPPILRDPSWALLDRPGRKLIGWHRAGEALARFTGRIKPTAEAAE